jgi:hypothetical protein
VVRAAWAVTTAAASFTWSDLGHAPDDPCANLFADVSGLCSRYDGVACEHLTSNRTFRVVGWCSQSAVNISICHSTYSKCLHTDQHRYYSNQSFTTYPSAANAVDVLNTIMTVKLPAFYKMSPADELLIKPVPDLTFCLAERGQQYIVYSDAGKPFVLDTQLPHLPLLPPREGVGMLTVRCSFLGDWFVRARGYSRGTNLMGLKPTHVRSTATPLGRPLAYCCCL